MQSMKIMYSLYSLSKLSLSRGRSNTLRVGQWFLIWVGEVVNSPLWDLTCILASQENMVYRCAGARRIFVMHETKYRMFVCLQTTESQVYDRRRIIWAPNIYTSVLISSKKHIYVAYYCFQVASYYTFCTFCFTYLFTQALFDKLSYGNKRTTRRIRQWCENANISICSFDNYSIAKYTCIAVILTLKWLVSNNRTHVHPIEWCMCVRMRFIELSANNQGSNKRIPTLEHTVRAAWHLHLWATSLLTPRTYRVGIVHKNLTRPSNISTNEAELSTWGCLVQVSDKPVIHRIFN